MHFCIERRKALQVSIEKHSNNSSYYIKKIKIIGLIAPKYEKIGDRNKKEEKKMGNIVKKQTQIDAAIVSRETIV